jgi:hypothetical protein
MGKCDINDGKAIIPVDPRETIEIVGGNKIEVFVEKTATKSTYTVNYREYAPPTISVVHAGPGNLIQQVGVTVPLADFLGGIYSGSNTIVERTMVPDKSLDLSLPISFTETDVLGTSPGLWPQFSGIPTVISAKDDTGTIVTKQVGVEYRYPFYMIYTTKSALVDDDSLLVSPETTTDLLTSILSKYNSFTYNYSAMPVYVYWVFPVVTTGFSTALEGSQIVPLKLDCSSINITLPGVTLPVVYRVIRTAVKTRFTTVTPIILY